MWFIASHTHIRGFSPERHDGCGLGGVCVHSYLYFGYNRTAEDLHWTKTSPNVPKYPCITEVSYFLVVRHILLISAYSLISAFYFAGLTTRNKVHLAYKCICDPWPLCLLDSSGLHPFRVSQNYVGYSQFSGF